MCSFTPHYFSKCLVAFWRTAGVRLSYGTIGPTGGPPSPRLCNHARSQAAKSLGGWTILASGLRSSQAALFSKAPETEGQKQTARP